MSATNAQLNAKDDENIVLEQGVAVNYIPTLGNYAGTTPVSNGGKVLFQGTVATIDIVDGSPEIVLPSDDIFKAANLSRDKKDLRSNPFNVDVIESTMLEPMTEKVIGTFLDKLTETKDGMNAVLLENRADESDAPSIAFDVATFATAVRTLLAEQKSELGITQSNAILVIHEDVYTKLLDTNMPNTSTSYWSDFVSKFGAFLSDVRVSAKLNAAMYLIETSVVYELKGFEPTHEGPFDTEAGSVFNKRKDRFYFSTDDIISTREKGIIKQGLTGALMSSAASSYNSNLEKLTKAKKGKGAAKTETNTSTK